MFSTFTKILQLTFQEFSEQREVSISLGNLMMYFVETLDAKNQSLTLLFSYSVHWCSYFEF